MKPGLLFWSILRYEVMENKEHNFFVVTKPQASSLNLLSVRVSGGEACGTSHQF